MCRYKRLELSYLITMRGVKSESLVKKVIGKINKPKHLAEDCFGIICIQRGIFDQNIILYILIMMQQIKPT